MSKQRHHKRIPTGPTLRLDQDGDGKPAWLLTYHDGITFNILLLASPEDKRAALQESIELLRLDRRQITLVENSDMWVAERVRGNDVGILDHEQPDENGKPTRLLTVHRVDGHDPWPLARILAKWLNENQYKMKATKEKPNG